MFDFFRHFDPPTAPIRLPLGQFVFLPLGTTPSAADDGHGQLVPRFRRYASSPSRRPATRSPQPVLLLPAIQRVSVLLPWRNPALRTVSAAEWTEWGVFRSFFEGQI